MAKRDSAVDVSEVTKSSVHASISGVVTTISPMKRSKRNPYFEGSISDGISSSRLFRFDGMVRRRQVDFEKKGQAVVLDKCEVKPSRLNADQLEVLVSPKTMMEESGKVYQVIKQEAENSQEGKEITMPEVKDTPCFERVTVKVKISDVDEITEVKGGKKTRCACQR